MELIYEKGRRVYLSKVMVKPIAHHYENEGEHPYIKYSCPICDSAGCKHQVIKGAEKCNICGINFIWEENK